jgi:hypothetical protein
MRTDSWALPKQIAVIPTLLWALSKTDWSNTYITVGITKIKDCSNGYITVDITKKRLQ